MAISAISPIVVPPVLSLPLAQLRQLNVEQPFNTALTNTLNTIASAPAALKAASTQSELVSSLERALFNQWMSSLQSTTAGSLGTSLDSVLAGNLGVTGTTGVSNLPFDTSNPQSRRGRRHLDPALRLSC